MENNMESSNSGQAQTKVSDSNVKTSNTRSNTKSKHKSEKIEEKSKKCVEDIHKDSIKSRNLPTNNRKNTKSKSSTKQSAVNKSKQNNKMNETNENKTDDDNSQNKIPNVDNRKTNDPDVCNLKLKSEVCNVDDTNQDIVRKVSKEHDTTKSTGSSTTTHEIDCKSSTVSEKIQDMVVDVDISGSESINKLEPTIDIASGNQMNVVREKLCEKCMKSLSIKSASSAQRSHVDGKEIVESSSAADAVNTRKMMMIRDAELREKHLQKLKSWLNQRMIIEMTDGRFLAGMFLCTDRDANVILGSCAEYCNSEAFRMFGNKKEFSLDETRLLGLVMVPGQYIVKILHEEQSIS